MKKTFLLLVIGISLTSCYRMPGEDDYSVVPTVNNPAVTREKAQDGLQSLQGGAF